MQVILVGRTGQLIVGAGAAGLFCAARAAEIRQSPLAVRGMTVSYDQKPAVFSVDATIRAGRMTAIIGPNGAAKSTLLKAALRLVSPLSGVTTVFGAPLAEMRQRIAYVPQRASVDWDFPTRVEDVVAMGLYRQLGLMGRFRASHRARVSECLARVGMEDFARRQIGQLSGGQQQRVFLARALAQDADLYLLDEPFAGVDAATERAIIDVLKALRAEGRILPAKPERMSPGETRAEFLTAEWKPVLVTEAHSMFSQTVPLPDAVFAKYAPAQMHVGDAPVLHIHPPGGLRYAPVSRDRVAELDYGIMPEIWEKERDTDGVRFRAYVRGPDGRDRLIWEDFVQPRTVAADRGELHATFAVPANHHLELRIDAVPDHNPGYDWSYISRLELTP